LTFFEFILVMTSVIYALSVAPLLSGIVRIAQSSYPVHYYLPQAIWTGNTFIMVLLMWWALWGFRAIDWTFADFVFIVCEPVLLLFACSLLFPQRIDGPQVDLKSHFERISRLFFATSFVLMILVSIDGVILGIESLWDSNRYFQATGMALFAWAYADRRPKSQLAIPIIYFALLLVFVGIRWLSPPG
jgi:hypothetical protein